MSQETIERTFEVGTPAALKLANIRGSIEIQAGEEGVIAITAVKHLNSGNEEHTEVIIEQEEDGRVVVKTDYQQSVMNWFGLHKPCKVEYAVQVPASCHLKVSGVSCNISVQGVSGEIDVTTVSGKLNLSELTGQLKLGSVSGSIKAEALTGTLDANAVSGKVRLVESEISEAVVKTVSGSIVVQTPLAEGPYMFKGVSGSLTMVVPADTGCIAHHKSVSGRLKTSLPITQDKRYGSRGWLEIQGGGPEITYKSVSGSFRVVTAEGEQIVEQHKVVEPIAAAEPAINKVEILQKIESGELSVEDALKELNA